MLHTRPFRVLLARPRLLISFGLGIATYLLLPNAIAHQTVTRALIGWNVAAVLYLVLALVMMMRSSHERMRRRALVQDEGSTLVLVLVIMAALACVGAIVAELGIVKELQGSARYLHVGLAASTIATSWMFTQTMFALHYAHDYYASATRGAHGGLDFPGNEAPDYGDFLYCAIVIGTSAQTADVSLSSRRMRRTGIVHCMLAFFFNTTLLALTINIASGLF
jgi:uncharacterized membrane protein